MSVESQQFQNELEKARVYARSICAEKGENSPECAAAWDAVEEMQAEVSHQQQAPKKSNFEKYVEENPDAPESRIYED
ncbi:MAG: Calvin cycle protein CP12 [Cyanobacteria bacterium]|nr:Calvin cycle protein CP12 [Cyanobacteriota bacterium]MDA0864865.1 Calvin cycle protein CP12 [Cyanobacteriota bacterium]